MEPLFVLTPMALQAYARLRYEAVVAVSNRVYAEHAQEYERFGERGRQACREDLEFHLDFLRPVLETGLIQPYADYLRWFAEVLATRRIPNQHVGQTLQWLGEFFHDKLGDEGQIVGRALQCAFARSLETVSGPADATAATLPPATDVMPTPLPQQAAFEATLLRADRRAASAIVDELMGSGLTLVEVEVRLIQQTMHRLGLRWQNNEISVAQEHLATATAHTVMAHAFASYRLPALTGKRALLACVEGNQHALGLQMISDALESMGWEVQLLGANMPTRSLVQQVQQWRPDLVGLSVSFPHHVAAAREAVGAIRAACKPDCPRLLLGGIVINQFPALVSHIGADGFASDALSLHQAGVI